MARPKFSSPSAHSRSQHLCQYRLSTTVRKAANRGQTVRRHPRVPIHPQAMREHAELEIKAFAVEHAEWHGHSGEAYAFDRLVLASG